MENERIKAIHDAAVHLFLQQGYARTQISHIAREVGVSVGTIYHDFAGKQEIMHFVLKCTITPGYLEKDFERPVTDDLFRGLEEEIMQVFRKSAENFSGRLKQGKEAYDFPSLISDAFDMLAQYAVGCLFIEKNQFDFPVLARNYREYREHFFRGNDRLPVFIYGEGDDKAFEKQGAYHSTDRGAAGLVGHGYAVQFLRRASHIPGGCQRGMHG